MYPFLAQNIIYPLADLALQTSVMKKYHWLQKTQWWSPEKLRELQNIKLRSLIKHAYNNVPYYRNLFEKVGLDYCEIRNIDSLTKLPILTKADIRCDIEGMTAKDIKRYHPIKNATGGSTGNPLQYYITKELASINWAGTFRAWGWAGYKIGDKYISFGGSSLVPGNKPSLFQRMRWMLERDLPLSAVSLDEIKYSKYVGIIRKNKIKYIYGYPSSIFLLADYCKTNNINDIRFDAVFSTAEVLLPHYRQLIEKQFTCKIFDQYGSYDGGAQALECEAHEGLHMTAEMSIIEIIDDNGKAVPFGQPGRIIVTDLYNYAMPFIRYDVGDIGVMSGQQCSCGRGLPLLKAIEGRTTDIVRLSNGKTIAGPAITLMFKDCHVKQYQLVQEADDQILVKIVRDSKYTKLDTEHCLNILRHHAGDGVKINLEFCEEIPTGRNSKYKFVISKTQLRH